MVGTATPAEAPPAPAALHRWLVALVALGLAWRLVRYACRFPLWGDEAFLAINILRRDYGGLLQPLEYFQVAPLLFLWVQRAVVQFCGGGEFALRLVPLVAGGVALWLQACLARHLLKPRAAALAVGTFAASYYLVRHTCECKPYATDLLAATVLLCAAVRWQEASGRLRRAVVAGGAAAVLIWLSYPATFVAAGMVAALLRPCWRAGWRARIGWVLCGASALGSFAVFHLAFLGSAMARTSGSWLESYWAESFPPHESIGALLLWLGRIHAGRMLAYPVGGPNGGSILTLAAAVTGAIVLTRSGRGQLVALLLAPALPTFAAAWLHRYPYGGSVRVAIHFAPAICLLAGAGAAAALERVRTRRVRDLIGGALGMVLVVLPIGGAARDLLHPYKAPEDAAMRQAMADFARLRQSGETVAIHNPPTGTYGPPDGPAFHQTLRYYLELYTGVQPRWLYQDGYRADVRWILAFHGLEFGPDRQRVDQCAGRAGLKIEHERCYPLRAGTALRCTAWAVTGAGSTTDAAPPAERP